MRQLEEANPETFAVERRSHWAAALNVYLNPAKIAGIWEPWPDAEHPMDRTHRGILSQTYRAHGDPSVSGANFGWAVAHIAGVDDRGLPHVCFDDLGAWLPRNFADHQIDYDAIGNEWEDIIDRFMPDEVTFDQFSSAPIIQRLQRHVRTKQYPKRVVIYERTATAPLNWKTYEAFKTALGLGLVHAPYFELADQELTFLQDFGGRVDHPTSGPVQTKDVADCLAIVVNDLIGDHVTAFIGKTLSGPVSGSVPGGVQPFGNATDPVHEALSNFGRRRRRWY
jgi:hypothetical protein